MHSKANAKSWYKKKRLIPLLNKTCDSVTFAIITSTSRLDCVPKCPLGEENCPNAFRNAAMVDESTSFSLVLFYS